jgi:hypothetical protein
MIQQDLMEKNKIIMCCIGSMYQSYRFYQTPKMSIRR